MKQEEKPQTTKPITRNEVLKKTWYLYLVGMLENGKVMIKEICTGFPAYVFKLYSLRYGSKATALRYIEEDTGYWGNFDIKETENHPYDQYLTYRSPEIRIKMINEYHFRATKEKDLIQKKDKVIQ